MSLIDIKVPDRNEPGKTVTLKRYVIDASEEPTAIIFGKFSPFSGKKGHGRMIEFAKSKGIKNIAVVSPERADTAIKSKYDANIFTPQQRQEIITKALTDYFNIPDPEVFTVKATNPLGMFREFTAKVDRPIIICGPDREKEYAKFFIPYNKTNPSVLNPDETNFGKGEYLAMNNRGDGETSGTAVRKALVDGDEKKFIELTGYDSKFYVYLRDMLKKNNVIEESFVEYYKQRR